MPFTVSIVGRPNVGKSTLFNRLTKTKHAIVDDLPGVTRDRREGDAFLAKMKFKVIDTAGLEEAEDTALENRMMLQTKEAILASDLCYFVIDGRLGLTPVDEFFARWLRKLEKSVILLINKSEGGAGAIGLKDAYKLGFEDIISVSAEHKIGFDDMALFTKPYYDEYQKLYADLEIDFKSGKDKNIQIAIVGRPNTGKSTLVNSLLQENRMLTGPEAGITRDSIAIDWEYKGRKVKLIDTAGIRRKTNIEGKIEKLSVSDSLRSLCFAHVGVLMVDAQIPFEKQDLAIAQMIIREGRSMVVAINKWDLIKDKEKYLDEIKYKLDKLLPQVKGVPFVTISALNNKGVNSIIEKAFTAYDVWNQRVPTSLLNNWIKMVESEHLPPLGKNNKRIRLKYITQSNCRPPTFALFANLPEDMPQSYRRYISNSIRKIFKLPGVPIRLMLRKSYNPYEKRKKKK